MDNRFEQLQYLKGMTVRLGCIHEAQALQLRNYPLLIPNVGKAIVKVNAETKHVIYDCTGKTKNFRKTKKVDEMFQNIYKWTTFIVWDDVEVLIKVNNKELFKCNKEIWKELCPKI